jgi:ABC-type transport system involved in cytochrome bd biosynthesis fused ATPase/permease subunit
VTAGTVRSAWQHQQWQQLRNHCAYPHTSAIYVSSVATFAWCYVVNNVVRCCAHSSTKASQVCVHRRIASARRCSKRLLPLQLQADACSGRHCCTQSTWSICCYCMQVISSLQLYSGAYLAQCYACISINNMYIYMTSVYVWAIQVVLLEVVLSAVPWRQPEYLWHHTALLSCVLGTCDSPLQAHQV